ncbi:MAG: amidohydrolase family protein [Pseudomonadota bacterium]|nr:amidohydrolase family protein [Pseudomonadota bacterium]
MRRRDILRGMGGAFCAAMLPFSAAAWRGNAHAQRAAAAGPRLASDAAMAAWRGRLESILAGKQLPIIDLQATYVSDRTDAAAHMKLMDREGVAQTAFAPAKAPDGSPSLELHRRHPAYFIPTTSSGEFPRWWKGPEKFVGVTARDLQSGNYVFMGEHEFRHYPSPEQAAEGRKDRDITVDITGPAGQALFALSAKTGVAFQIHYEIEDTLLPPLESMLERFPQAKVIWCHLGQVRYPQRARKNGPAYVAGLIRRFPGLHFDLAVPKASHVYKPSGVRASTLFLASGELDPNWRAVIEESPQRFLSSSDYRPDVASKYSETIARQRQILAALSEEARALVAYRNAWRLVTGTDWSA